MTPARLLDLLTDELDEFAGVIEAATVPYENKAQTMTVTIELDDELAERLDRHLEEDESYEELIEELVSMYETEGEFLTEGYSE